MSDREGSRRLAGAWRALAVFVLNSILLLLLVNLVLAALFKAGVLSDRPAEPVEAGTMLRVARHGAAPGSAAYEEVVGTAVARGTFRARERFFPGRSPRDVAALTLESRLFRPFVYEPFAQFGEGPYRGQFVNVDAAGFRGGARPLPWPPDAGATNVFVFGGSTTFGDGLPDEETVPAHLEDILRRRAPDRPVRVYNFGCAFHFSTQERVRFERLLVSGVVPDVAVFVDGLNDFYNRSGDPEYTERLRDFMARGGDVTSYSLADALAALPIGRAAMWVRAGLSPPVARPMERGATGPRDALPVETAAERILTRYLENRRLIEAAARAFDVRVLSVWQPVPAYGYDLRYHAFRGEAYGVYPYLRAGYSRLAAQAAGRGLGEDFAWCADIQQKLHQPLYLDQVHYSPRMARRVARCIARALGRRIASSDGGDPARPLLSAPSRLEGSPGGPTASGVRP